ncbi:MAG: ABC transporter ATP-binding protein [Methylobacter sp.]|nr:ABC transporter ATP-binding protein [Methylobacter sp.]
MSPIIRFDQVSVTAHEKTILSNISFALFPGEKTVLYGKSDSGKSSLLRTLVGLHSLKSGTVYFQEKTANSNICRPFEAVTLTLDNNRFKYVPKSISLNGFK